MHQSVFNLNKNVGKIDSISQREVLLLGGSGSVGRQAFELCIENHLKIKTKQSLVKGSFTRAAFDACGYGRRM